MVGSSLCRTKNGEKYDGLEEKKRRLWSKSRAAALLSWKGKCWHTIALQTTPMTRNGTFGIYVKVGFIRVKKTRAYFQFFYALRAFPPYDVIAVSPEIFYKTNSRFGEGWMGTEAVGCEAIQLATGLFVQDQEGHVWDYRRTDIENSDVVVG